MEILGIDVGGTGIKGALVNIKTGELTTERHRIRTPKNATPKAVAKKIQKIIDHFQWNGLVGCGFPTPLMHGKCITGGNLHEKWEGVNVKDLFKEKTGNEFSVVNDADAAGLAEVNFGIGKNKKGVVVMITLGTGIGSGIFLDGKLLPNTELGHIFTEKGEEFENYAADSVRKKESLTQKQWGKRLHEYFRHLQLILSPDLIIIGGSASKRIEKYEKQIDISIPLVAAESQNDAGIIGAAVAAKYHL